MTTNTQTVQENFQSIKVESGRRTQKIADILKAALSESVTEVKDGASTVRPLAKDLANNAVKTVKEKGQAAYVNAKQAAQETATDEQDIITQFKLKLQAIVDAIKATLFGQTVTQTKTEQTETVVLLEPEADVSTEEHVAVTVTSDPV